jgi:hypothetical protein
MHASNTLRILMAFVLAASVPMWCQCMVSAVAAAPMYVEAHDDMQAAVVCCGESCMPESETSNTCSCECCDENLSAATALGTSAMDLILVHSNLALVDCGMPTEWLRPATVRVTIQGADPPESPPTLLTQRCLLQI